MCLNKRYPSGTLVQHARAFYNKSDASRWSVDVRYQSSDVPNNVGEGPEDVTADRDPSTMACYPPEADVVILDSANREN